jgi:predicted HD superfamily hydrolase involved in NAD metabolism
MLARDLARRHGADPGCAELAGWLHDWLKPLASARLEAVMKRCGKSLDRATRAIPPIWHGPAAAAAAPRVLGVRNPAVLDAVRWHSTGRRAAGPLERILFVADFCAGSPRLREARIGRRLARRNLTVGLRYVLASRLAWLRSRGLRPHPAMTAFWAETAGGPRA